MRRWILKILVPLWLVFLVDMGLYFGLNSQYGAGLLMHLATGGHTGATYKAGVVRFSPSLQHFCARDLECSDETGRVLLVKSMCGQVDFLGIMGTRGRLCLDSLKIHGMEMNVRGGASPCIARVKTEVHTLNISEGKITIQRRKGKIMLSDLMVSGNATTNPLSFHGQIAGKYGLVGHRVSGRLLGQTGDFRLGKIDYQDSRIAVGEFSINNRVAGSIHSVLPLGQGPMSLAVFQARFPGFTAMGTRFNNIGLNGLWGSVAGVRGELNLDYFHLDSMKIRAQGVEVKDLWGAMDLSATLLSGLDIQRLDLHSDRFDVVFSGASESPMDASNLQLNVVAWNVAGDFLRKTAIYPTAESGHLYSGVGTLAVRLRPFKTESLQIHWVTQWSPVF